MKTLIIDNYDSFTYNLYQILAQVNADLPLLIRNDEMSWDAIQDLDFDNIVVSPGPGHPDQVRDFGVCREVILKTNKPLLGICLGHQGIFSAFGGSVVSAPQPMHGRLSKIQHVGTDIFKGLPQHFSVVRYHSLIASEASLPKDLIITARTDSGLIMGLKHQYRPIFGLQFHPESIETAFGFQFIQNFADLSRPYFSKKASSKKPHTVAFQPERKKNPDYTLRVELLESFYEPEQVFHHFCQNQNAVWLDSSAVIPGYSRFSYLGMLGGPFSYYLQYDQSAKQITIKKGETKETLNQDLLSFLSIELARYRVAERDFPFAFQCGFVGYFAYEMKADTLGIPNQYASPYPDAQFLFLDRVIVFDHEKKAVYLLGLETEAETQGAWFQEMVLAFKKMPMMPPVPSFDLGEGHLRRSREQYLKDIAFCQEKIHQGESYEICLTNEIQYEAKISAFHFYRKLRQKNPTPFSAFLCFDDLSIASSSMERFLKISSKGGVETKPIKGTLPRGKTPEADQALKKTLAEDEKFRSENLMIVDLLRHDLGSVCEIGSVQVPALMQVESYHHVHQLVSTVRGQLKTSPLDCFKACFPGGSMTGAPKLRTLEIIETLEKSARGIYSGALGFLSLTGALELNIIIRTAILQENVVRVGVGGAITSLSDPEAEFEEILLKANSMR